MADRKQEVCGAPSALAAAAHGCLAALAALGAAAPCRYLLVLPGEQGFDFGGDLALVHCRTPLLVLWSNDTSGDDGFMLGENI